MTNSIRIIAGKFKGRKIPVLERPGLRPTPDRVRETLFNWLMMQVRGARCLDLCAGTGALGLEALSRGADHVVAIDQDDAIIKNIHQTAKTFGCEDQITLKQAALPDCSIDTSSGFDLIFLDPPYQLNLYQACLDRIDQEQWLQPDGLIYIELPKKHPFRDEIDPGRIHREGKAGQIWYALLEAKKANHG